MFSYYGFAGTRSRRSSIFSSIRALHRSVCRCCRYFGGGLDTNPYLKNHLLGLAWSRATNREPGTLWFDTYDDRKTAAAAVRDTDSTALALRFVVTLNREGIIDEAEALELIKELELARFFCRLHHGFGEFPATLTAVRPHVAYHRIIRSRFKGYFLNQLYLLASIRGKLVY